MSKLSAVAALLAATPAIAPKQSANVNDSDKTGENTFRPLSPAVILQQIANMPAKLSAAQRAEFTTLYDEIVKRDTPTSTSPAFTTRARRAVYNVKTDDGIKPVPLIAFYMATLADRLGK
jgi:hypothetical protein